MKSLSSSAKHHLDALRQLDAPPSDAHARVWDGVVSRAAAGQLGPELGPELGPSSASAGASQAAGATGIGGAIKLVAIGVLVGAGAAVAIVGGRSDGSPSARSAAPMFAALPGAIERDVPPVPEPAVVEAPIPVSQPEPEASAETPARPAAVRSRPSPRPDPEPEPDLAAEVALLGEARSALGAGEAKRAITLLGRHRKQFPRGELARERDVSWITALCVLGRVDEARTRARVFLGSHGNSPHAAKVRASCGGDID